MPDNFAVVMLSFTGAGLTHGLGKTMIENGTPGELVLGCVLFYVLSPTLLVLGLCWMFWSIPHAYH